MKRRRVLTPEEVAAVDRQAVDSVMADRLIETIEALRERSEWLHRHYENAVHMKVALWLAETQDELAEAASWVSNEVSCWIEIDDIAADPWAHDWRKFWASRDSITGESRTCNLCGDPATTFGNKMAACGNRHWKALNGELPDEQCRLCNDVRVCAHDLDGSPVCADCWPGERLLAERRRDWAARFYDDPDDLRRLVARAMGDDAESSR